MFAPKDLTIVIPTLGRDPGLLAAILAKIPPTVRTIVVWDGHAPPAQVFRDIIDAAGSRLVCHEGNRGLAAGRNTGADAAETTLCMFIDDDIVPETGFIEHVIAFHCKHPEPLSMMLGCVTWRGGPFQTPLTDWFEIRSPWSQFHTVQPGKNFNFFAGGFTSFKTLALRKLRFDESFIRYGCEDTEFGYRFFQQGGTLTYCPEALGIHMKRLDLATYRRDNIGAGYSYGRMLDLHPDVGMDVAYIVRAINTTLRPAALDHLVDVVSEMLANISEPANDEHCDQLLRLMTSQCQQQGLVEYLAENHPGFAEARADALAGKPRDHDVLLASLPAYAPFRQTLAETSADRGHCLALIDEARAGNPRYAAPHLLAFDRQLPDAASAGAALVNFLAQQGAHLDRQTYLSIRKRLDRSIDGISPLVRDTSHLGQMDTDNIGVPAAKASSLTARDLYFHLSNPATPLSNAQRVELAQAILARDISHVGARLVWAEAISAEQPVLARILLGEARYFLGNRPVKEQQSGNALIATRLAALAPLTEIAPR